MRLWFQNAHYSHNWYPHAKSFRDIDAVALVTEFISKHTNRKLMNIHTFFQPEKYLPLSLYSLITSVKYPYHLNDALIGELAKYMLQNTVM